MGTKKNNLGVRIAMAVIGIALTAVSVGLQKISGLLRTYRFRGTLYHGF